MWFWSALFPSFVIGNDRIHYSYVHSVVESHFNEGEWVSNQHICRYNIVINIVSMEIYHFERIQHQRPRSYRPTNNFDSAFITYKYNLAKDNPLSASGLAARLRHLNNADCLLTICLETFSHFYVMFCWFWWIEKSPRGYCSDQKFCWMKKKYWMNHCWQCKFPHEPQYSNERTNISDFNEKKKLFV